MIETTPEQTESLSEDAGELRRQAWRYFEGSQFAEAALAFEALETIEPLKERELRTLIEILIDRGDLPGAAGAIQRAARGWSAQRDEVIPFELAVEFFDLSIRLDDVRRGKEAAMLVLECAASSESAAIWQIVVDGGRLDRIEACFDEPLGLLDALEQETFAPDVTHIGHSARARIEEVGHSYAGDGAVSRASERLLHALGEREAAYRVQRARRAKERGTQRKSAVAMRPSGSEFAGLSVAIAGGHPALRALIRADLTRAGVRDVREVPSAKEASRVGRDVQAVLAGVDVAVVLVRQIAHSTSEQIRRAGDRLAVPVLMAESSGLTGVRRSLERFVEMRTRP